MEKHNTTVLAIFIVFVVIALLLILFLSIILIRNIYFKKNTAYISDLRITLQRENTKNKDAIQKCAILAKNEKTFEPICDKLKTTNQDICQKKDVILQHIVSLEGVIQEKKFFKVVKERRTLRRLFVKYRDKCKSFDQVAQEFDIDWKLIDEVFTNYLEIVEYYKEVLNKNKAITTNLNPILTDKVQKMAKRLNELDNSKYKGQFSQADKKIDDLRVRLNDLNNLIIGASKIEYYLFDILPNELKQAIKKETKPKVLAEYKVLSQNLEKLSQSWYEFDSNKLALNIVKIYDVYWKIYHGAILNQSIKEFFESVKKDLSQLWATRKKLYLEVQKETSKLNRAYNALETKVNAINNLTTLADILKAVKEFLQAVKTFDDAYLNYKLEAYHISGIKVQRDLDLANAIETYFAVIENEHLINDPEINEAKKRLQNQFETNIKKYKSWAKHQLVWDDFIHTLAFLIKKIAINEKYHEMYDALCLEVASNERFLLGEEKINAYKELINQTRLQIQQNNNYQESYQTVKRFLIKEKYVQ
ncbi:hypothetical protein ACNQ1X_00985 [Mycoplasma sp. SK341A]|uniref:hypothetical protein n=1 Tax=Mycoplasma sp. SK341A TaxID=3401679 RepID=UPI003AADDB76